MDLSSQKRIAGEILKCSTKRVFFDNEHLDQIKEAITKQDMRELINANIVQKKQIKGISRVRANKIVEQKKKGRRQGAGSRRGKKTARVSKKEAWMAKVRVQRKFLKGLKEKEMVSIKMFRELYLKSKGGFFRSVRHIKYYMKDKGLFEDGKQKT
jgi:large subunit ribosomal protein L19e